MLYRLFVIAGALVVAVLFTALIAPIFIDWSAYKADFEREASRVVGQPVVVGGDVTLRILPLPSVSFEDLEVGRNLDGSPLMNVERFSFNAELMPFLSGEVRIVDMAMLRPQLNLKIEEKGTIAWTSRKELLVDPGRINIDKLVVENGSISIDGLAGGRRLNLENIQAEFSAKSLLGPWRIDANAMVEGTSSSFQIATGTLQDTGAVRVKIEASRADQPYRLLLDGPVSLENEVLSWRGAFKVSPLPQAQIAAMEVQSAPLPVVSEGRFETTPETVKIPEYRLEVGAREDPYTVTGEGIADIRKTVFFRLKVDGRQIDLDRLKLSQAITGLTSLEQRIGALRSVLERVPVPFIDGEIDIVLPAIVAGDTFIREVSAVVRPLGKGWDVRSLSAILPGNTKFEASGRVGLGDDFGFNGALVVASRQPTGFASWVSGEVDPAFRRLKSVGMAADVTISQQQATFDNLQLILDKAVLHGKLQRLAPANGQPGIVTQLEGDRINLDDLKAIYSLTREPGNSDLTNHDLDIEIEAKVLEGNFVGQSFTAQDVDAHVQVRDGAVSVERLNAGEFFGARIESAGRIENLLDKPNGNMKLTVTGAHADGLLSLADKLHEGVPLIDVLRSDPALTSNTSIEVELDTRARDAGSRGQALVSGVMGGTNIDFRVGFNGRLETFADTQLNITGSVENDSPERLLRQLGFDTLPVDAPGPLSATLELSGKAKDGFTTFVAADAAGTNATAKGTLKSSDWREFDTDLELTLGSADIAPYLLVSGYRIPGVGLDSKLPASLSLGLRHSPAETRFHSLKGQLGNNKFSGELSLKRFGLARPRLEGNLDLGHLSLPLISNSIFGGDISPISPIDIGPEVWSEENFGEPIYKGHDAKIDLRAEVINLGGGLVGTKPSFELVLLNNTLNLNQARFGLLGGEASANLGLKNSEGTVVGDLRFELESIDAEKFTKHIGARGVFTGKLSVNGTLESAGRSLSGMVASATGSGVVDVSPGILSGIDPASFENMLARSDSEDFEIGKEQVTALVEDTVLIASFPTEAINASYTASQGKIVIRNIASNSQGSKLAGNLEVDLVAGEFNANAVMRFDPGKEAISGADPELGFAWSGTIFEPKLSIDTGTLEGFLSLRAFERSQRRVEIMEASVLEKQRLRRDVQLAHAKVLYRERKEEEARLILEEQLRIIREEEERKRLEEAEREEEERQAEIAREAEAARNAEEARKAEEARLAEEERQIEEARKAEADRIAEEERQAEEAHLAEEALKAEEARVVEEAEAKQAELNAVENSQQGASQNSQPEEPTSGGNNKWLRKNIIENLEKLFQTK